MHDREPQPTDGPEYHADHQAWEERQVRKARSLQTRDPLWGTGGPDKKHFKLSGAVPTDAPSNGARHHKNKRICKKSPDHEHHYEVVVERIWSGRNERMVDQCSYCGKKKGYGFTVWIGPKPEWIKRMEERRGRSIF